MAFILNLLHATLHTGGSRCLRSKAAQQYFAFSHAYFPDTRKFKLFLCKILREEAWETYWTPLWIHINNYFTLVTGTKIHAVDGDVWARINCPDFAMLVAKEMVILLLLWKFSVPVTCISKNSGCEPVCHHIVNNIYEAAFQQPEKITYLSIEQRQIQKEAI